MKIAICNWRYVGHPRAGGAEFWTQRLAEGLSNRGHDVTILTASHRGARQFETVNAVKIVRLGGRFTVYKKVLKHLKEHSLFFDLVLDEVNTRPFFLATRTNCRAITMFHQLADDVWDYELPIPFSVIGRRILEPRWLKELVSQQVIALSNSTALSLSERGFRNIKVIEPGVDDFSDLKTTKFVRPTICFLGRLVDSKRPADAVRAFETVRREFPAARLIVVGDGPQRNQLQKEAPAGVQFIGRVDEEIRNVVVAKSHVLVATSVREGWGMNVTEAAALGTIAIGYAVPGLVDSIKQSGGILVKPNPESLASALIDLLKSTSLPAPSQFGRTWDSMVAEIEREMFEVVSRPLAD